MYFALAIDAEHFGELPRPECKPTSPDKTTVQAIYGMTDPEGEAEPPGITFEDWCESIKGMTSRARHRVAVDGLSPRRRAWWDEQMAHDPKWLAWNR
jgi:hypothetical protein